MAGAPDVGGLLDPVLGVEPERRVLAGDVVGDRVPEIGLGGVLPLRHLREEKNITFPVGSSAAWIATIGNVAVASKSQRPISLASPRAAAWTLAACRTFSAFSGLGFSEGAARIARLIAACSRACSGPSVAVSQLQQLALAHAGNALAVGAGARAAAVEACSSRGLVVSDAGELAESDASAPSRRGMRPPRWRPAPAVIAGLFPFGLP